MATWLRRIKVKRVALVDNGANQDADIVFWKRDGKTVRAEHLGKKGYFNTRAEAESAVFNAETYGTQRV